MALQQVAEVPKVSGEERVTILFSIFKLIILEHLLGTDHMPFLRQKHGLKKIFDCNCLSLSRKESVDVLGCVNARVRLADVCSADSKSEVVDTHAHLGTKIAPCVSWNRVCTEPGGTGFRHKIRSSQKITRRAFFKK